MFNMAVMGLRLAQRANGVSQLHGQVSRGMFEGLWPGFDDTEVPITSITNGVHAPTWVDRRVFEVAEKHVGTELTEGARGWEKVGDVPPAEIWAVRRELRAQLVADARRAGALVLAAARRQPRRAGLGRRRARPGRADHRLRPPRAHLQAADPDAARPRPAQGAAARPGAPGAAGDRGQVAPRRRPGQAADPAARAVRRRPRGAAPHRLPAQLRHRDGADPLPGLRRLAEQPAAPARGVRHVRA